MSKIFKNTVYDIKPQKINVNNTLFPNKKLDEYNIVVPPNIFQTWHTKQLPPMMFKSIQQIKKNNPRFNYFLFDDNDCREFIKNNFSQDILNAYDSLIQQEHWPLDINKKIFTMHFLFVNQEMKYF